MTRQTLMRHARRGWGGLVAGMVVLALVSSCAVRPDGTCGSPTVPEKLSALKDVDPDAELRARLYVFRGECPPPGVLAGGEDAETTAPNKLGSQESVVTGDEVELAVGVSFAQQLKPPFSYCARLVFRAKGDARDDGRHTAWPRSAFDVRVAHQDSESFQVQPYAPVCPVFGPLEGADAAADPAVFDADGDGVPNLQEVRLALRPVDADDLEPPGLPPQPLDAVTFPMGTADGFSNEGPPVMRRVESFSMDVVEVTNRQYRACMGKVVDGRPACDLPAVVDVFSRGQRKLVGADFDAHPVVGVTHAQAEVFCAQRGMRLPTELEWERAARVAADQSLHDYPFEPAPLETGDNTCSQGRFYLQTMAGTLLPCTDTPVMDTAAVLLRAGQTARTAGASSHQGVVDLAGNVAEWTADNYRSDLHTYLDQNPLVLAYTDDTSRRFTVRGGSFRSGPRFVRGYARAGVDDSTPNVGSTLLAVGFRCVR
jgi:formylglycine-generating enzyme required for sulfatase activity